MSEATETLMRVLGRIRSRMRLQRAVDCAVGLSFAGALAAAAAAAVFRARGEWWWLAAGAAALIASALAGAAAGYVRRPALVAAALAADERLGLAERLCTMVDAAERGVEGELVEAQRRDAERSAAGRDFSVVRPVELPERARYVAVVLVVAFGIAAMPAESRGPENWTSAVRRAMSAAAGTMTGAAEEFSAAGLDPEDLELLGEIREAAEKLGAEPSSKEAAEGIRRLEERVTELVRERQEKQRLENLRHALAEAREALEEAGGEDAAASSGRAGGEPPQPPDARAARPAVGGLSAERALDEGSRRYPAYALVLRRYFSAAE